MNREHINHQIKNSMPFNHVWHNQLHLEMPFGLINDPNGLAYLDGEYHIFFQWNPLGCTHENKSWGYVKTKDFIHYSAPTLAMWPSDAHDKDGCYSGCGYVDEAARQGKGALRFLYTCNAKNPDEQGELVRTPAQRICSLAEDGTITKDEIIVPTNAPGYTPHFRDPYIWQSEGRTFFVLGAQRENKTGAAVLYEKKADKWVFAGEIQTDYPDFGFMWECPNLLTIDGMDVLAFCPQGLAAEPYRYQNRHQAGYIVGKLELAAMRLQHNEFQELDRGFDFYAPQFFQNTGNRHIMLGWMGMPDEEADHPNGELAEAPWRFSLTMPREITLKDGHLYSQPVEEMKSLRLAETIRRFTSYQGQSYQISTPAPCELDLNLLFGQANNFCLTIDYGNQEALILSYDKAEQVFTIDRTSMVLGGKGKRQFKLPVAEDLTLQLFLDKGSLEVFFQGGYEAASMLLYPTGEKAPTFSITTDVPWHTLSLGICQLNHISFHN